MTIVNFLLVIICVFAVVTVTKSQQQNDLMQEDQEIQAQAPPVEKSPLNRETIEAIFQQISAGCRSEMEAVMESAQSQSSSSSSGDVSPACKEEIQASAQRVAGSGRGKTNKRSSSASSSSSSSGGGDTTSQKEDAASVAKDSSQSILVVVAALFLLFGIVIGYAIYANANLSQQGGSQKKSLRKKDKKSR